MISLFTDINTCHILFTYFKVNFNLLYNKICVTRTKNINYHPLVQQFCQQEKKLLAEFFLNTVTLHVDFVSYSQLILNFQLIM